MKLARLVLLAVLTAACGTPAATGTVVTSTSPTTTPTGASESAAPTEEPVVLAAAGDISSGGTADDETAALVERLSPTRVLTLGDNQYPNGAYQDFLTKYDASWGAFRSITLPTPGNHDCMTPGCAGYFQYFGEAAGEGHYAVELGDWLVISVNSESDVDAEAEFVRTVLADDTHTCQLVAWHHPRWSSGKHGSEPFADPLWQASVTGGADVVLNGHDHSYERFAPLDAAGATAGGTTREFVVGTGGAGHYGFETPLPGSEVRIEDVFGVLRVELQPSGYAWSFHSTDDAILDEGTSTCH